MSKHSEKIQGKITVKQLREYLHEMEKNWTKDDEIYFGKMEDQYISIISRRGFSENLTFEYSQYCNFAFSDNHED